MKIKMKQSFRSLWAMILAILMVLSTFTAAAVSLNLESSGATSVTLYWAVGGNSESWVAQAKEFKFNINDGSWHQRSATNTNETFNSYPVYKVEFETDATTLNNLQLQGYDGSSWKGQLEPSDKNISNINGKIYYNNSWQNYSTTVDEFVVAGSAGLCGSEWSNNDENNLMTYSNGVYTKTYTNVQSSASNYEYKVVKKNDWGTAYPTSGNKSFSVSTSGSTVTITYDPSNNSVSETVTAPQTTEYYIGGRFKAKQSATGSTVYTGSNDGDWSDKSTNIKLTETSTSGVYSLNTYFTFAELSSGQEYWFHIVKKEGSTTTTLNPSSNTEYSTSSVNAKTSVGSSTQNFRFNDSTATDYKNVVIFFDSNENKVWFTCDVPVSNTVNISVEGTGGTVSPSGDQSVGSTAVNISATPSDGYHFVNWTKTGDVTIDNANSASTSITATGDGTVKANFAPNTYTLKFDVDGGTPTYSDTTINYGDAWSSKLPASNPTKVGYTFTKWQFNGSDLGDNCNVNQTNNSTITLKAVYSGESHHIAYNNPSGGSWKSGNPESATVGSEVTVNVQPESGYEVFSINYEINGTAGEELTKVTKDSVYKFTMPAQAGVQVNVIFSKIQYNVKKGAENNGTFTVSASKAGIGDTITVTPTPADGYEVKSVKFTPEGESAQDITSSKSFTMPAKNVTVDVEFQGVAQAITKTAPSNGGFNVASSARTGETVNITDINPASGFTVDNVKITKTADSSVVVAQGASLTSFTMPAYPVTVSVTFKSDPGSESDTHMLLTTDAGKMCKDEVTDLGTVYVKDGTYTVTITNKSTITTIVSAGNIYFALSSSGHYYNMYDHTDSKTVTTDTPSYVNVGGNQSYNGQTDPYRSENYNFGRTNIKNKTADYSSITISYKPSTKTYKVNAYTEDTPVPTSYNVTVAAQSGGTASIKNHSETTITVDPNASVTFVAEADGNHIFDGWYDGSEKKASTAEYTTTITKNLTLTAHFKDASGSKIYVMNSVTKSVNTSNLTNLVEVVDNGDGTYSGTASLTAGDYYLVMKDPVNHVSGSSAPYSFTGNDTTLTNESGTTFYNYDGAQYYTGSKFTVTTPGSYTFTWKPGVSGSTIGNLKVSQSVNKFIETATTSVTPASIDLKESATVSVSATTIAGFTGDITYTLVNADTGATIQTATTTEHNTAFTVTPSASGTYNYKVVISTTALDNNAENYSAYTTNTVNLTVKTPSIYYANTKTGVASDAIETTYDKTAGTGTIDFSSVTAGNSYTFSLYTSKNSTDVEHSLNFAIDESSMSHAKMTTSTLEDGTPTYIVTLNTSCKDLVVHFDSNTGKIWATASYSEVRQKTLERSKKVTYYFAEHVDETDLSKTGDGVRIHYWNNSHTSNNADVDVTTPVNVAGKDTSGNATNTNKIYVNIDSFFDVSTKNEGHWGKYGQFKVYSVELPIWATSFQFVKPDGSYINTKSYSYTNTHVASNSLNPNRIYCLFNYSDTYYSKGIVLDKHFWEAPSDGRSGNEVSTKNFTSQLVNYKDMTSSEASGSSSYHFSGSLNSALSTIYGSSYSRQLYVGNFYGYTGAPYNHFRTKYNLAQSKDSASYYASVWGLVGSQLGDVSTKSGFKTLRNYQSDVRQPLFDYDNMTSSVGTAYNNLDFPFYESKFNGITTYSYDSQTDRNRLFTDGNFTVQSSTIDKGYAVGKDADDSYSNPMYLGYFPFGGNDNYYANTGFGTEFDINFYMSDSGYLKDDSGNNQDIAFNFSGDDDVWVYVDGVKVLDLGGAHKVSAGQINFSQMKVYYKTAAEDAGDISEPNNGVNNIDSWPTSSNNIYTIDLSSLMSAYSADFDNTDSTTEHTLQMFYMERGCFQSNMSISFNLPQNSGLRINNTINTDNVNAGLVDAALNRANSDYFNYSIQNSTATNTQVSALSSKYGVTLSKTPSGSFSSELPKYPFANDTTVVRTGVGDTDYYLTATGKSQVSSTEFTPSSSFANITNVNFTLADFYSAVKSGSGTSESSGRVTGGAFNLLFKQSASFNSKIQSNTLIKLAQSNQISYVNVGNGSSTVITKGSNSRLVSDYYTVNYKVTDDDSKKVLSTGTGDLGSTGAVYAKDSTLGDSNSFFFANYTGTTSSNNAMTIDYENVVRTGNIKIQKSLSDGKTSATDTFYFQLQFKDVFGAGQTSTDYAEYEGVTYKVYNVTNSTTPVATRTYGKAGIYMLANQYAVVEGVPVGTQYKVVEKSRAGYNFNSATGSVSLSDGSPLTTVTQPTAGTKANRDITGEIPNISSANNQDNTINIIDVVNDKVPHTITFKYYDHKVENGVVASINTKPSEFKVTFDTIPEMYIQRNSSTMAQIGIDIKALINNAFYGNFDYGDQTSRTKIDNVIDGYAFFDLQATALDAITYQTNYHTDGNKNYGQSGEDLSKHFDCYGYTSDAAEYSATDGEDWVTYYDENGNKVTEYDVQHATDDVFSSISVWLFNVPKKYTINFVTPNAGTVKSIAGSSDLYVGDAPATGVNTQTAFYNQRLGVSNTEWKNNLAGKYLNAYGITEGYTGSYPSTPEKAETTSGNEVNFLYWSYDPEGKIIASTDIQYGYRITNSFTLYAIYGSSTSSYKSGPGLSLEALVPDNYIDNDGVQRTRLNNIMNVYNCDSNDSNIKQASIIYVRDNTNEGIAASNLNTIMNQVKTQVAAKATGTALSFVVTVSDSSLSSSGYVYDIVSYGTEASALQAVLTNKNRLQFSNGFKTQSLINGKVFYAFASMRYDGTGADGNDYSNKLIMADNVIKYSISGSTSSPVINSESIALS